MEASESFKSDVKSVVKTFSGGEQRLQCQDFMEQRLTGFTIERSMHSSKTKTPLRGALELAP